MIILFLFDPLSKSSVCFSTFSYLVRITSFSSFRALFSFSKSVIVSLNSCISSFKLEYYSFISLMSFFMSSNLEFMVVNMCMMSFKIGLLPTISALLVEVPSCEFSSALFARLLLVNRVCLKKSCLGDLGFNSTSPHRCNKFSK